MRRVLLDLSMPVMDGWEFLDWVRRDERHAGTPICVISAISEHAPPGASLALEKPVPVGRRIAFLRESCPLQAGGGEAELHTF